MCGIAGFYDAAVAPQESPALLRRMIGAIAHRGPDGQGVYHADGIGLAHARLSIIDLATGAQPMSNEDGSIWITFNGEIFNYIELREDLVSRGYRFRTRSDTEVIIRLYEAFGADCVKRLNGDFAFAIWDAPRKELLLARDRMGVRPLFYTGQHGKIAFASEIKALLAYPGVEAVLDPLALDQIFTFWFPLAPRTGFKNIFELPPAHIATFSKGRLAVSRYWSLEYPETRDDGYPPHVGEAELEQKVYDLFLDATRIRLRADVPTGAYLSGGFDSSVTAAAIRSLGVERLRTFSVEFEAAEFDESAYQKQMIEALGAEHSSLLCRSQDIEALLPQTVWHAERPILRTAPAPLLALSRLVRGEHFKVVLTGEGADEVFAGYDVFKEAKLRRFSARQPHSHMRKQLLRRLYPYLPGLQAQSQGFLEAFFVGGDVADPLYSHMPRFRSTAGTKAFYSSQMREELRGYDALADLRDQLPEQFSRWHPLSQAQYLETAHLLPQYILSSQGDRMSMANAVEGRFPFLDHRLVELAAKVPAKMRIRALQEKAILRRSIGRLLPAGIAMRPKQPYRAPHGATFLSKDAPSQLAERLTPAAIESAGYFDAGAVARLLKKAGRSTNLGARDQMAFVGILSTQLWHQAFVPACARHAETARQSDRPSFSKDVSDAAQ